MTYPVQSNFDRNISRSIDSADGWEQSGNSEGTHFLED